MPIPAIPAPPAAQPTAPTAQPSAPSTTRTGSTTSGNRTTANTPTGPVQVTNTPHGQNVRIPGVGTVRQGPDHTQINVGGVRINVPRVNTNNE